MRSLKETSRPPPDIALLSCMLYQSTPESNLAAAAGAAAGDTNPAASTGQRKEDRKLWQTPEV